MISQTSVVTSSNVSSGNVGNFVSPAGSAVTVTPGPRTALTPDNIKPGPTHLSYLEKGGLNKSSENVIHPA